MDNRELFEAALGLSEPWFVSAIEFDPAVHRLDIHLDFPRGTRFPCPEGDAGDCPVHDTDDKSWRHLDFFQHQAYLHARVPRVRCDAHGVRLVAVPWARPGSGFTLLFEALAMTLLAEMPVAAAARIVGEHDTRLWRLIHYYVDRARARRSDTLVRKVGVDETSCRRGHDYVSVFCDLEARRALFATEGRGASTVEAFSEDLTAHGGDPGKITDVCCDMSPAYMVGINTHLPDAEITIDRYHVVRMMVDAVDKVRREEAKTRPELRRTRYAWLKRPANLTRRQRGNIEWLTADHLALKTARAYRWRLAFDEFFEQRPEKAEAYLEAWYRGAIRSQLGPVKDFARTVRTHWPLILRWHESRISNGLLEGLHSLTQAAKRRARGYRTSANLIAMIYLIVGKLDLQLTHAK